jgi:hypothetical protein
MGLSTTKANSNTSLTKKEKVAALFRKHAKLLESLGVVNPHYVPKMVFGTPLVTNFFPSELRDGKDVYTEKVSKDYRSEDESRTLYKLPHNPNWNKGPDNGGYATKPFGHTDDVMYIIPFSEFQPIVEKEAEYDFGIGDPDEDPPLSELTIRDIAAILLEKPCSRKPWLNKIIKG